MIKYYTKTVFNLDFDLQEFVYATHMKLYWQCQLVQVSLDLLFHPQILNTNSDTHISAYFKCVSTYVHAIIKYCL